MRNKKILPDLNSFPWKYIRTSYDEWVHFHGEQLCHFYFASLLRFAPIGANSYLYKLTHFWKDINFQRSKQEITKVVPLCKKFALKYSGIPVYLKLKVFFSLVLSFR